jgi:sortase A
MSRMQRAARVLLAIGVLLLGYAAYVVIDAKAYQAIEQRRFDRARADAAATPVVVVPGAPATPAPAPTAGSTIGEIQIQRLGLTAMIVQGESARIFRRAVGHLAGTALPGESGNVVLAGHRDTFFRPLKDVRPGDAITVKTERGDFEYVVETTAVVSPAAVDVLEPTGEHALTLITCFPFYYVGAAPDRFVVRAYETQGRSLATSSGPAVVSSSASASVVAACCAGPRRHR